MSVFRKKRCAPEPSDPPRNRARASPRTNAPARGRASAIRPEIVRDANKNRIARRRPPPSRHVTLTTRTPSRPLQYLRDAIAAVEIDFGGGLFERIEVTLDDDPVAVAREFCQAKGFSLTISIPLAVKLAQARDKARRRARAARLGRPATAKPAMTSTLNAKARAKLDKLKSSRPASARAAALDRDPERPPRSITIATSSSTATRTSSSATTSACSAGPALSGTPPPSPSAPRNARRGDRPSASTALRRRPRKIARLAFARSRRPRSRRGAVPRSDSFSAAVPGNAVKSARRGRRLGCARWRRRARSAREIQLRRQASEGNPRRGTRRTGDCTRRCLKRRISLERCSISSTPTPCRRRSASSSSRT